MQLVFPYMMVHIGVSVLLGIELLLSNPHQALKSS